MEIKQKSVNQEVKAFKKILVPPSTFQSTYNAYPLHFQIPSKAPPTMTVGKGNTLSVTT
jgi:hypothetical protein